MILLLLIMIMIIIVIIMRIQIILIMLIMIVIMVIIVITPSTPLRPRHGGVLRGSVTSLCILLLLLYGYYTITIRLLYDCYIITILYVCIYIYIYTYTYHSGVLRGVHVIQHTILFQLITYYDINQYHTCIHAYYTIVVDSLRLSNTNTAV